MKKRYAMLFLPLIFFVSGLSFLQAESLPAIIVENKKQPELVAQKITDPHFTTAPSGIETRATNEKKIWFKFKDEPLMDVVNYVANAMKINVVLPQGPDVLTTKITFQYPEKVTPEAAYDKLLSFLKITGYSVVPQNDFHYIIRNTNGLVTQPFPLYINTPPQDLPETDQVIRYMYYFANIQVPTDQSANSGYGGGGNNALTQLLKDTLSPTAVMIFDSAINGMLITDYSRTLRAVMEIVVELDTHGFTDAIEIIQLKHTSATVIASLFQNLINPQSQAAASQNNMPIYGGSASPQATPSSAQYFAQTTRIVAETRSNSIIIMGKKDALKRIREFTEKYLDVRLGEGKSVLHIYPLQNLQAANFAPILQALVASQSGSSSMGGGYSGGSTGQSSGTANPSAGTQYFTGVIVMAEPTTAATVNSNNSNNGGTSLQPAQQGGNRLIIAAVEKDWLRIKKLIEDLDKPQPQVALEILIVDLSLTGARVLGSQVRNKANMFPPGVFAQNSTLYPIQLNPPGNPGFDGLLANLLQLDTNNTNMAGSASQGSFVFSLQDNTTTGIAWVMQVLNSYTNTRILSHPFAVSLNNQQTTFTNNETRLLPGGASQKGSTTYVPLAPVAASLSVVITPLINNDQYINLNLNITISEFLSAASGSSSSSAANSQINRQIITNANVGDGQVLVLGGLTKTTLNTTELGTPFLKDLPVIGWLFKKKNTGVIKSNLAIFISPKILESKNGTCDPFTASKLFAASDSIDPESNLSALRDPITRWFFETTKSDATQNTVIDFIERKAFTDKNNYSNLVDKKSSNTQSPTKMVAQADTSCPTKTASVQTKKEGKEKSLILSQKTIEQNELKKIFQSFDDERSLHMV